MRWNRGILLVLSTSILQFTFITFLELLKVAYNIKLFITYDHHIMKKYF